MLKRLPAVVVLTVVLAGFGAAAGAAEKPQALCPPRLPDDGIHQVKPDPQLPAEIKAFFGNWHGRWVGPNVEPYHGVPTILVVEEIASPEKVMVVLGWGECPECKSMASCQRFHAKITRLEGKQVLYFGFPEGKTYSFALEGDHLIGTDGAGRVEMQRLGAAL